MNGQGTPTACKTAIVVFSLVFLPCVFEGIGVFGACWRGALIAAAAYLSVKLVFRLFYRALIDDLTEFVRREKSARKRAES